MCLNCSGIHRSLSSHVKSIRLDFWEDKLVEVITVLSVTHLYFCCIRLCLCVILVCVCVFILGDGSSWNPMAMPGPRLNMRKLFHRTTIDPSGKTASRSFPGWWYLPTSVAMAESFMCNTRLLTRQSHKVEKWELLAVEVKYRWISAAKSSFNDSGFYKNTLLLNCEYFYIFTLIHSILREQWIRAKYERKEFTGDTKYPPLPYTTGDFFNDLLMNSLGLTFLSVSG